MRNFSQQVHFDTAAVVASAVPSRWARCTKLAGDSQRYNAHPFSDGGSVKKPSPSFLRGMRLFVCQTAAMALPIHGVSKWKRPALCWLACFLVTCGSLLAEQQLVIISPHWEGARIEFARAFSDWHRAKYGESVHIDWREVGGTSDIIRFIRSEFAQRPDGIGIDMLFGGGTDPYLELQKLGVLASYRPPEEILSKVPSTVGGVPVYDPGFQWFGSALTTFGIEKNKRVVEIMKLPDVHAWNDLTDSHLFGWVGSGDPRNSGSVLMMYEIILQGYGWEKGG